VRWRARRSFWADVPMPLWRRSCLEWQSMQAEFIPVSRRDMLPFRSRRHPFFRRQRMNYLPPGVWRLQIRRDRLRQARLSVRQR
jgi:hypothetical protein